MLRVRKNESGDEVATFDAVFVLDKCFNDSAINQARQTFYDSHLTDFDEEDAGITEEALLDIYDMPESHIYASINRHYCGLTVGGAGLDVDKLYFHEVDGMDNLYSQDLIDNYVIEIIDGIICSDLNERYPNKLDTFTIKQLRHLQDGRVGILMNIAKRFDNDRELSMLL